MKKTFLLFFNIFLLNAIYLYSATITSSQSGNWNSINTWIGSVVPTASDNVIIASGNTVSLTADAACNDLTITDNNSTCIAIGNNVLTVSGIVNAAGTSYSTSLITTSNGKLKLIGNSRALFGINWTGNNVFNCEIALSSGQTGTTSVLVKFSNLTITSGIFQVGTLEIPVDIRIDGGGIGLGDLTISSGATLIATGRCGSRTSTASTYCGNIYIYGTLIIQGMSLNGNNINVKNGGSLIIKKYLSTGLSTSPGNGESTFNFNYDNGSTLQYDSQTPTRQTTGAEINCASNSKSIYNFTVNHSTGIDLANNPSIRGTMKIIQGNITTANSSIISYAANATLYYNGTSSQTISSTSLEFPTSNAPANLTIDNMIGVILGVSKTINGTLTFSNGKLTIGNYDLTIGPSGSISGATSSTHVVTNGTGQLKQTVINNNTYISFPISPTIGTYNPVNIKLDGASTADVFGVRVSQTLTHSMHLPNKVVNDEWTITEGTTGGSIATIQFMFNSSDCGTQFSLSDPLPYDIGHWNSLGGCDEIDAAISTVSPDFYAITNSIAFITSFSPFNVGNNNSISGVQPVELASFTANIIERNIMLKWTTANEQNNSGFEIQRKKLTSGTQYSDWEKVTFVNGNGTKNTPTDYTFEDKKLNIGKYNYRLKQIDYNGNFEYFELNSEVVITIPVKFKLSQNYPNPFNPNTKIDIDVPFDCKLMLKVFDINGREIQTLINETKQAGYYTVDFNASSLASGIYLYQFSINNVQFAIKRMILVK